jgi:competence protein ComGC
MKRLLPVLTIVAVLLLLAAPAFAAEDHTCDHSGATIESLQHCVQHAYDMGHITKKDVALSLLAKTSAAQAGLDHGQPQVAIKLLNAFIREVNAQAGKSIAAEHAGHLVEHARNVITALGG